MVLFMHIFAIGFQKVVSGGRWSGLCLFLQFGCQNLWYAQEADGLVYAYILIWVVKNCGRSATGFEGVSLGFYI